MLNGENVEVVEMGLIPAAVLDAVQALLDARKVEAVAERAGIEKWLEEDTSERGLALKERCAVLRREERALLEELADFAQQKLQRVQERVRDSVWGWAGGCGLVKGGVAILAVRQRDVFGVEDVQTPWRVLRGEVTGFRAVAGRGRAELWMQVVEEDGCEMEAELGDLRVLRGSGAAELVPVAAELGLIAAEHVEDMVEVVER